MERLRNSRREPPCPFHEVVEEAVLRGRLGGEESSMRRTRSSASARNPARSTAIGRPRAEPEGAMLALPSLPEPSAGRDPGPGPCGDAIARQRTGNPRARSRRAVGHRPLNATIGARVHCARLRVAPCSNKAMHAAAQRGYRERAEGHARSIGCPVQRARVVVGSGQGIPTGARPR